MAAWLVVHPPIKLHPKRTVVYRKRIAQQAQDTCFQGLTRLHLAPYPEVGTNNMCPQPKPAQQVTIEDAQFELAMIWFLQQQAYRQSLAKTANPDKHTELEHYCAGDGNFTTQDCHNL